MSHLGRAINWSIAVIATLGGVVLFALGDDERLIRECDGRSIASMQQEAKAWIVSRLTKSRHPGSDTAIPDGTKVSEIENWGFTSEYMRQGIAFYTETSGGVAYDVHFNRFCGFQIAAQRCPKRQCQIGRLVGGS